MLMRASRSSRDRPDPQPASAIARATAISAPTGRRTTHIIASPQLRSPFRVDRPAAPLPRVRLISAPHNRVTRFHHFPAPSCLVYDREGWYVLSMLTNLQDWLDRRGKLPRLRVAALTFLLMP